MKKKKGRYPWFHNPVEWKWDSKTETLIGTIKGKAPKGRVNVQETRNVQER